MGHGTYTRQVLGWDPSALSSSRLICVRRYRCRGCRGTISVLPDALYPGRWFTGVALLVSLFLSLVLCRPAEEIRRRFGGASETHGWKSLWRWRRQLLSPLWGWLGPQLGFDDRLAPSRDEQRQRLLRMLALHGVGPPSEIEDVEAAARALIRSTAHEGKRGRPLRHAPGERRD